MTVSLTNDDLGPVATVSGRWTSTDATAIRDSRVRRLRIFGSHPDLDFLGSLDGIDEVRVQALGLVFDTGVMGLPGLKVLGLETYSKLPIDFGVFDSIERLAFNWRPNGETAFGRATLRSLRISRFPYPDLRTLSALMRLEGLRIANTRRLVSLHGIEALGGLRVLSLRDDQVVFDIGSLAEMDHSLTEIELQVCRKITDISALARHTELRRIMLIDCGHIASLAPLADLPLLEEFWFYGTTVIDDGDMTPLLRMPALQRVSFGYHRKTYSHSTEDIERLRGLQPSDPLPHWRW